PVGFAAAGHPHSPTRWLHPTARVLCLPLHPEMKVCKARKWSGRLGSAQVPQGGIMDTGMVGLGDRTRASVVYPEAGLRQEDFVFRTKPPEAFTFVLFGATGDLAGRKLFPALASLLKNGYLPPEFALVGTGRREKT